MPSSPEPHLADTHTSSPGRSKRKERPPALDFKDTDETRVGPHDHVSSQVNTARLAPQPSPAASLTTPRHQPLLRVQDDDPADDQDDDSDDDGETALALARSASATSSLDPYYFGTGTPSESPVPSSSPMPPPPHSMSLRTPELGPFSDPVTPHKDPAAIDRRGLVGVGELATPRWARGERKAHVRDVEIDERFDEDAEDEGADENRAGVDVEEKGPDLPDSPWTIEAIDGEPDDLDEASFPLPSLSTAGISQAVASFLTYSRRHVPCARGAPSRTRAGAKKSCIRASSPLCQPAVHQHQQNARRPLPCARRPPPARRPCPPARLRLPASGPGSAPPKSSNLTTQLAS